MMRACTRGSRRSLVTGALYIVSLSIGLPSRGTVIAYADRLLVNTFLMRVNVYPEIVGRFDPTFYDQ